MWVVASELAKSHTKAPNSGVVGAISLEKKVFLALCSRDYGESVSLLNTGFVAGTVINPSAFVFQKEVKPFKITVAAIVKNEAENVPTWVQAARSCADEIVVVDTGSTDDTVKRFADYGIKCFHYDWNDDFASAKNYMISLCHGDWIVLLDGDEWFREGCDVRKAIAKHHNNPVTKAIIADWICLDKDRNNVVMFSGGAVRAFRNQPDVRYFRKVHENLTINYENFAFEPEFKMYHTGYSGSVNRSKHERNLRIMRTMFDFDNGKVEYPTDWRYIEDTYAGLGQFDKALWAADKMISYGVQEYSAAAWITKFNVLFAMKTPLAEMKKQFEYCFQTVPSVSGFRFLASIYYFRNGQIEAGLDNYIEGLRMLMGPQDKVAMEHTYWRMYMPEASALASAVYLQNKQFEASLYVCKVCEQYCGQTDWTNRALADVRRVMNQTEEGLLGNISERVLPVLQFGKKVVLATAIASSLTVGLVGVANPVFASCVIESDTSVASDCGSVAIGGCFNSAKCGSVIIGGCNHATSNGLCSIIIGGCNISAGFNSNESISIDSRQSTIDARYGVMIGADAMGQASIIRGLGTSIYSSISSTAEGDHSTVLGGLYNYACGFASLAIGGCRSYAYANESIAIGGGITGTCSNSSIAKNSVAIGKCATTTNNYEVAIGSSCAPVKIDGMLTVDGAKMVTDGTTTKTWSQLLNASGGSSGGATAVCFADGVVLAGCNNTASGCYSSVSGGNCNFVGVYKSYKKDNVVYYVSPSCGDISGNVINVGEGSYSLTSYAGCYATVAGGFCNMAIGDNSSVIGGNRNIASGCYSIVNGGNCNVASGSLSLVNGGECNIASCFRSVVSGGAFNQSSGQYSSAFGGQSNIVSGNMAVGVGGCSNSSVGLATTTIGGYCNSSDSFYSTVIGGENNTAYGCSSTIIGGCGGYAHANYSTVIGGGITSSLAHSTTAIGSVAIGKCATTTRDYEVTIGSSCAPIKLDGAITVDGAKSVTDGTTTKSWTELLNAGGGASYVGINVDSGSANEDGGGATGTDAIAIGKGAVASGDKAISIGTGNQVRGDNSGAIGDPNIVDAHNSYTVGNNSTISANVDGAFVLGNNVTVNNGTLPANWDSLTDGEKSDLTGEGVIALGNNVSVSLCNKVNSSRSSNSTGSPKIQHVVAVGDSAIVGEENAVALGYQAESRALNALASGTCAKALSEGATALGQGSIVHENSSFATAVGYEAEATGEGANAFGDNANAGDKFATAFGRATNAQCEASTAIGNEAVTTGKRALAIGNESVASAEGATSVGNSSNAVTRNAVSIGNQAVANGEGVGVVAIGNCAQVGTATSAKGSSTAVGAFANVQSTYSTALGAQTSVTANNSVALGAGSVASQANVVSVGAGTATDPYPATRKIINVTDGTANTDVSTVGQTGRNLALSGSTLSLKNANGTVLDSVTLPSAPIYTAGNGLELNTNNEFTVKAGTNVTVDANGVNVAGNGTVASGNTGLISGGTLHSEVRPASNGNYITTTGTTGSNLTALDTQLKTTTDNLATEVTNRTNADTALGNRIGSVASDGNYIKASSTKNVAENLGLLDTQVKANATAISNEITNRTTAVTNEATARESADTALGTRIDGTIKDLSVNGQTITYTKGNGTIGTITTQDNNTEYTAGNGLTLNGTEFSAKAGTNVTVDASGISVAGNGVVSSGNTGLVSGGTVFSETRVASNGNYIQTTNSASQNLTALDTAVKANADAIAGITDSDTTYSAGNGLELNGTTFTVKAGDHVSVNENGINVTVDGAVAENNTGIVSGGTVYTAVNAEKTARESADTTLQTNITNEKTARESADTTLQTNIDNEVTARETAVSGEATARANADTTLQGNIDTLSNIAVKYDSADTKDKVTLTGTNGTTIDNVKDATLSATSKEAVTGSQLFATNTNINTEVTNRTNADTALSDRIGTVSANGNYIKASSTYDVTQNLGALDTAVKANADAIDANKVHFFKVNSSDSYDNNYNGEGATGGGAIAIGQDIDASGVGGIAIGTTLDATSLGSIAIGSEIVSSGVSSIGMGDASLALSDYSIAIGSNAGTSSEATNAVAIGHFASATGVDSVAIGTHSDASEDNTVSFGTNAYGSIPEINRRLVHVAAGVNDTDAVNVSQLTTGLDEKANVALNNITDAGKTVIQNATNVVSGDSVITVTPTTENGVKTYTVTANVSPDGQIAEGNTGLVSGGTVYSEVRPSQDGNYIVTTNTIGANLTALDTQVKVNADAITTNTSDISNLKYLSNITEAGETVIKNLAKGSVNVVGSDKAIVTKSDVSGIDTYTVSVKADGQVAQGNENIVSGGTVYDALSTTKEEIATDLAGKANVALNNVTDAGHTVIKTDAKSAINVVGGTYATVDKTDVSGVDTYTVNVATDGQVVSGDTKLVTGGTVYDALQSQNTEIQTALDGKANVGLDNITDIGKSVVRTLAQESVKVINGSNTTVTEGTDGTYKTYAVNTKTDGTVASGDTGIVTGGTVYDAIQNAISGSEAGTASDLSGKANVGLDNITDTGKNVIKSLVNVRGTGNVSVAKTNVSGVDTYTVSVDDDVIKPHYVSINSLSQDADSNYNNDGASGQNAIAIGQEATATAKNAVAIGYKAKAEGEGAFAFGEGATSQGKGTVAFTGGNKAYGTYSMAWGMNNIAGISADGTETFMGATAFGTGTEARNSGATAMGNWTIAEGQDSVAMGNGARTREYAKASLAMGQNTQAAGSGSFAGGSDSIAGGFNSFAFGDSAEAAGDYSTAIGDSAKSIGEESVALGYNSKAYGDYSVAILGGRTGNGTFTYDDDTGEYDIDVTDNPIGAFAAGFGSVAMKDYTVAIGRHATVNNDKSMALGEDAIVSADNSVALGTEAVATEENVISVGHKQGDAKYGGGTYDAALNRRIVNVAEGINDTDAVNVKQLTEAVGDKANEDLGNITNA